MIRHSRGGTTSTLKFMRGYDPAVIAWALEVSQ